MEQNNEGGGRQGKREIAVMQMKKCSQNATVTVNDIMEALNNLHRRVEDLTRVCYAKFFKSKINDESTEREREGGEGGKL